MIWVSGQSLWVPRSVRMINPTTQITCQTLFIVKSRTTLNFYDFWGTKIKSFQFAPAFWSPATDTRPPPLSPEIKPKIIRNTTKHYNKLCNQLIFPINHLFRFIPRSLEHPLIWSLHCQIVLSQAFQMILHSSQSGKNWWSYGLDGFGWHSECSNSALMYFQAFVLDETSPLSASHSG